MSRESFNRGNSPDYQCQIRIGARRRSTWRIALQLNPPTSFLLQFPSTTPWSSLLLLRRGGIGQQQKTFWMASRRISDIEIANMGGMNKWTGTAQGTVRVRGKAFAIMATAIVGDHDLSSTNDRSYIKSTTAWCRTFETLVPL